MGRHLTSTLCLLLLVGGGPRTALGHKPHAKERNVQNYYSKVVVSELHKDRCDTLEIHKALSRGKCAPRETVVHLMSDMVGFQMHIVTDKVLVKRCLETGCFGINSCVPTRERTLRVPVMLQGESKCVWAEVQEHSECACRCPMDASHCSAQQEFVPRLCACRCRNHAERNKCRRAGKIWDDRSCTCTCPMKWMECSTGAECVRVMNDGERDYLLL